MDSSGQRSDNAKYYCRHRAFLCGKINLGGLLRKEVDSKLEPRLLRRSFRNRSSPVVSPQPHTAA